MTRVDHTGKRFGRLLVIGEASRSSSNKRRWQCQCDCGKDTVAIGNDLVCGRQISCGCKRDEEAAKRFTALTKHGLASTPVGRAWKSMVRRCSKPTCHAYRNYGGRGIKVCEYIAESPAHIVQLIGERPTGRSIDRKDNDGHYSCGKCAQCKRNAWPLNLRWATRMEQTHNRRPRSRWGISLPAPASEAAASRPARSRASVAPKRSKKRK